MKREELLAILNNPESSEEKKASAFDAYEKANKPVEPDTTELDALKAEMQTVKDHNASLIAEKRKSNQQAEEAARENMSNKELIEDFNKRQAEREAAIHAEYEQKIGVLNGEITAYSDALHSETVGRRALEIASSLSDYPEAILPHVKDRIGFEKGENGFESFVKGTDGKRTTATIEELKAEISALPFLAPSLKSDFSNKGTQEKRVEPVDKKSTDYKQGDSLSYLQSVANSVGE